MITEIKSSLWRQFGAAIDMFENAIAKCPPGIWDDDRQFWYIAYHTLFFLDLYLDKDPNNFMPPKPYTLSELDPEGVMPERTYTKDELLTYVHHCREKARKLIQGFNEESIFALWKTSYRQYNMFEMQLYNMRHVMHHTGQLSKMLGEIDHGLPLWVSQTKVEL